MLFAAKRLYTGYRGMVRDHVRLQFQSVVIRRRNVCRQRPDDRSCDTGRRDRDRRVCFLRLLLSYERGCSGQRDGDRRQSVYELRFSCKRRFAEQPDRDRLFGILRLLLADVVYRSRRSDRDTGQYVQLHRTDGRNDPRRSYFDRKRRVLGMFVA